MDKLNIYENCMKQHIDGKGNTDSKGNSGKIIKLIKICHIYCVDK